MAVKISWAGIILDICIQGKAFGLQMHMSVVTQDNNTQWPLDTTDKEIWQPQKQKHTNTYTQFR